jgi:VWFA-related protein
MKRMMPSKKGRRLSVYLTFLFILLSGGLLQSTQAQETGTFKLRVEVNLVTAEVSVLDKDGNPVRNLKREDFELYEDGKRQDILSLDEVQAEAKQSSLGASPLDEIAPPRGKIVLMLFTYLHPVSQNAELRRESAEKFLTNFMRLQDLIAVGTLANSMRLLQPFTGNREEALAAVRRLFNTKEALDSLWDQPHSPNSSLNRLHILQNICSSLMPLKGPKTVLIYGSHYVSVREDEAEYNATLALARRANVTFYTIDPAASNSGIPTSLQMTKRSSALRQVATLSAYRSKPLALDSGGDFIDLVDADARLEKLDRQISNYYTLGFQSSNPRHEGKLRKLKIKVAWKGAQVQYRSEYQDRQPADLLENSQQEKALSAALASPGAESHLPVVFRPVYFYESPQSAGVFIASRIRIEKIAFKKKGNLLTAELAIMGAAFAEDGNIAGRFSQTLPVTCEKDKEAEFRAQPLTYRNSLSLHPGKYRLKVAVADATSNLGSVEQSFEIPAFSNNGPAVSSLVLVEQISPVPELIRDLRAQMLEESDPFSYLKVQITPRIDHKLNSNSDIPVFFRIYSLSGASHQAGWTAKAILRNENGKEYELPLIDLHKMMVSMGNGEFAVSFSLRFLDVPPGRYSLRIEAAEPQSGEAATLQTDIDLI